MRTLTCSHTARRSSGKWGPIHLLRRPGRHQQGWAVERLRKLRRQHGRHLGQHVIGRTRQARVAVVARQARAEDDGFHLLDGGLRCKPRGVW